MEESGEFSDELDEFEESFDQNAKQKALNKNRTTYQDKPYDEAYEISQDLSMAESFDGRQAQDKVGWLKIELRRQRDRCVVCVSLLCLAALPLPYLSPSLPLSLIVKRRRDPASSNLKTTNTTRR
jgi:hypothetical protein